MTNSHERYQVAKRTSFVGATVNFLLAIFKVVVGYLGNSHALMADGLHSFSDLISDSLVLIASKAGIKNPDSGHPYGHQRIETIAAIIIAVIFLGMGASIIYDAVLHFLHHEQLHVPSVATFIVAGISVFANEWLYRYTLKKGKSVHSNLLITNAWHNRTDVFVSLIVLISVVLAWFGLKYFDAIGAAIIASLIVKIGMKMIWDSFNELIDAGVDEKTLEGISTHIRKTPGVTSIHQLRTRTHGGNVLVDAHILVDPKISVSEGHFISEQVLISLNKTFKKISDVTVHIDPEDDEHKQPSQNLLPRQELQKQLEQCWGNLLGYTSIINMQLHYLDGQLHIEIAIPMHITEQESPDLLIKQYRDAANSIKNIGSIVIHYIPG